MPTNRKELQSTDTLPESGEPFVAGQEFGLAMTHIAPLAFAAEANTHTVTIDDPADGDKTFTVDGKTYTYTAASQTDAQVAAAWAAVLNADPVFGQAFYASASGAVITLTAWSAGVSYVVASGTDTTAAETQAAGGTSAVSPGLWVEYSDGYGPGNTNSVALGVTSSTAAKVAGVVVLRNYRDGSTAYERGDGAEFVREGLVAVPWVAGQTFTKYGAVYADAAGLTYSASAAGRFAIAGASQVALNAAGDACLIRIDR